MASQPSQFFMRSLQRSTPTKRGERLQQVQARNLPVLWAFLEVISPADATTRVLGFE
jgi:hypothetical protein